MRIGNGEPFTDIDCPECGALVYEDQEEAPSPPPCDISKLADALDAGASADIYYDYRDDDADDVEMSYKEQIESAQIAQHSAADLLRKLPDLLVSMGRLLDEDDGPTTEEGCENSWFKEAKGVYESFNALLAKPEPEEDPYFAWIGQYKPIKNHIDDNAAYDGCMFETFGKEVDHIVETPCTHVWTLIENDGGQFLVSGYHYVDRLGYFVTEVACPDDHVEIPMDD
jgi:hypothetical protein